MKTYTIPVARLTKAKAELDKVNRRAERSGIPGIKYSISEPFGIESPRYQIDSPMYSPNDTVNRQHVNLTFDETRVGIAGYTPVATLDYAHDTPTIFEWPGKSIPDHMRDVDGQCSHCNKRRSRRYVYILQNNETGEYVNIGKSCIQDYIGYSPEAILSTYQWLIRAEKAIDDDLDVNTGSWGERDIISLAEMLPLAVAVIEHRGWTSRAMAEKTDFRVPATSDIVSEWFWSYLYETPDEIKDIDMSEDARKRYSETANRVIETARNIDTQNIYETNLKIIAHDDYCTLREFGLAVSMVSYAQRVWDNTTPKPKQEETSIHMGNLKDRLEIPVTIELIKPIDTAWGVSYLFKMRTVTGNCLSWFASNPPNDIEEGDNITLRGTVKAHTEWQGRKETQLTRCKVI